MSAPSAAPVRVGTRGSRLAIWQADAVAARLAAVHPGLDVQRIVVKTAGDKILDTPLSKIGDKGLFTKELEAALQDGTIDLAVHSLKDLPTKLPEGLVIGAVLERGDPRDVLVSRSGKALADLPPGAKIGTSSVRRRAQVLARRPDLRVEDLRGNVPTRIEKLERGEYDAIVLAQAGVERLGLALKITDAIDPSVLLPAVGQGAIAVEVRGGDARILALIAPLDHHETRLAVAAERALLARLEGGCQVPIGALATLEGNRLTIQGLVADLDGKQVVRAAESADLGDPAAERARRDSDALSEMESRAAALGVTLGERLLELGARPILERIFADARRQR